MTKEILAQRVGSRCSNPNCRKLTSGPQENSTKAINIGVAAHITAASPNGPRYDPRLSPEERRSIDNGIWLCQNCAKLIDNDSARYTITLLCEWKVLSERASLLEIESTSSKPDSRMGLLVRISSGFEPSGWDIRAQFFSLGYYMLFLQVANPVNQNITITKVSLFCNKTEVSELFCSVPYRDTVLGIQSYISHPRDIKGTKKIPFELKTNQGAIFWIPLEDIKFTLQEKGTSSDKVEIRGCFRDALGNAHYSDKFCFDLTTEIPFDKSKAPPLPDWTEDIILE